MSESNTRGPQRRMIVKWRWWRLIGWHERSKKWVFGVGMELRNCLPPLMLGISPFSSMNHGFTSKQIFMCDSWHLKGIKQSICKEMRMMMIDPHLKRFMKLSNFVGANYRRQTIPSPIFQQVIIISTCKLYEWLTEPSNSECHFVIHHFMSVLRNCNNAGNTNLAWTTLANY